MSSVGAPETAVNQSRHGTAASGISGALGGMLRGVASRLQPKTL